MAASCGSEGKSRGQVNYPAGQRGQREPAATGRGRKLPAGFLLPHQRRDHRIAAAAPADRGSADADRLLSRPALEGISPQPQAAFARGDAPDAALQLAGNIRQLENMVRSYILIGSEEALAAELVPPPPARPG